MVTDYYHASKVLIDSKKKPSSCKAYTGKRYNTKRSDIMVSRGMMLCYVK
jgi:hypothetical protein